MIDQGKLVKCDEPLGVAMVDADKAVLPGYWIKIRDRSGEWHYTIYSPNRQCADADYEHVRAILFIHGAPHVSRGVLDSGR